MSSDKYVKIYRGTSFFPIEEIYISEKTEKNGKIIIFDLDETIGSFSDLYILWQTIEKYIEQNLIDFNSLMDLYPEFLRHGILQILEFLYYKKIKGECSKIFIYTNNQCIIDESNNWVQLIINYIEKKIATKESHKLFDQIVQTFKIGDKQIELKRTSHSKTSTDFIKCTLLPKTTEICFIDNSFFPKMIGRRVYYIQPRSYIHYLKTDEIIDRFISSNLFKNVQYFGECFESILYESFLKKKSFINMINIEKRLETDILISQKMMYYIREFFYLHSRRLKTRKLKITIGRFTRKK
jgi:hypothetical protein